MAWSCSPSAAKVWANPIQAGPKCGSIIEALEKKRRASAIWDMLR